MGSSIKSSVLQPALSQELVTLVSGLGTEMMLYLAISDSANRQANIDAALATLDANDAAVLAYASAHNLPAPTAVTQ